MMVVVWTEFLIAAVSIWIAGARLSRYGDAIAEKSGVTRSWIGLILLATATSLPELATGISASALAAAPDLALGDALGSCVFNLLILALLDVFDNAGSIFTRASQGHILAAGFGVVLLGAVALGIVLAGAGVPAPIGHVGVVSVAIALGYVVAMRTVFRYERRQMARFTEQVAEQYADTTLRRVAAGYAIAAAVVVGSGIALPFIGERIAVLMGWERTVVATLFMAAATSAPELAVTVAAVRLGSVDMAIANLLGSNLFDVLIITFDDLAFTPGPILAHVAPLHVLSALTSMTMSGVIVVGLLYQPQKRSRLAMPWVSAALIALYLLNTYVLWHRNA